MANDEQTKERMNEAAAAAERDFYEAFDEETVKKMRAWVTDHYKQAGFKRLGRIIAGTDAYSSTV